MKTKTKSRKSVKIVSKPKAVKRTANEIIASLKIAPTIAPVVVAPVAPVVVAPMVGTFSHAIAQAGPRKWFQLATTPELSAHFDILKAKMGCHTANELAGRVFDEAFVKYGVKS